MVGNVRPRRRVRTREGDRQVDRLDERGAAHERIRDQGQDLLRQATHSGERGKHVDDQISTDAKLHGRLVGCGDVGTGSVIWRCGV